jgi:hypothetical protein
MRPTSSTAAFPFFLDCVAARQGPLVSRCFPFPLILSLPFACARRRVNRATPRRGRAMGWLRQPGDPHAEGPAAPARESYPGREGKNLFYPRAQSPVTSPAQREEAALPRAPGQSKPGQRRDLALPLRRRGSKARGEAESQLSTATNPIGVFPFHPIRESTVRGSRRRRRCYASPREDAATPARRRRARGGVRRVARHTGRRRGREPGAGARAGATEYIADVNTYTTGGIYFAGNAFTARNTDATPPIGWPRLHRRPTVSTAATLLSSPPWSPSCDGFATSRRVAVIPCLSAGHRAAGLPYRDEGSSIADRALGRRRRRAMRTFGPAVVPGFLVQGRMGASPPRFEPRPWLPGCCAERARRGRACTCTVATTHRRALVWDAGIASGHGGARSGS